MNPNEHHSRRAVRYSFIGVFAVVVGVLVAIYNRGIREHLGLRRNSATDSQPSLVEPSFFTTTGDFETQTPSDNIGGIELPPVHDPSKPRYDLTKNRNDVCPLHQFKMAEKIIEIEYGPHERWVFDFERRKQAEFPFAYALVDDDYISPVAHPKNRKLRFTCYVGPFPPPSPPSAKMFVCPQCIKVYESAVRTFDEREDAWFKLMQEHEQRRRVAPSQQ